MAWEKRVVWTEGMMLQPHHFQQQSRYHDAQLRLAIQACSPALWGFTSLQIDPSLLKTGKLCVLTAQGVMRDGTPFDFPQTDCAPKAVELDQTHLNAVIYLALPVRLNGNTEFNRELVSTGRLNVSEHEIRDVTRETSERALVEMSGLNFTLRTSLQDNQEYDCLAIAQVEDISPNGAISLSSNFIPPVLNGKASEVIGHFLTELVNLQRHRIDSLASRVSVAGKSTGSEVTDFIMLQTLNRHLPALINLDKTEHASPFFIYDKLITLIGDMSTLIQSDNRVPDLPEYLHSELSQVFNPIITLLRQLFSVVLEQNSIQIPLQQRKFGIQVGAVADKTLFNAASFILAVGADVSLEDIRQHFPAQLKIGAVESIKNLVNLQLPGIQINHLAAAPREIPYQRQFVYFELVQTGEYWQELVQSGGIALHVGANYPNLTLELWAIRS